ncbi:MAG TPA: flavin reductase family protein [Candidatus Omnitrophota bacterium]|nr:flavin reductase family protein [Candidatus Omnitrophota bacterium]HRY85411.1 flavin reductase family protein [Candidatus Omnitrophota bacterium]
MKKPFPLAKVYTLLEPGAVAMVTTALKDRANIMTMSWHTMIDFDPPLAGLVIGDQSQTFQTLKRTGECVINIPETGLLKKAVACGNVSGRTVNKFKAFGLTPVKASKVKAPLVKECPVNLECKVVHRTLANRYNFFILKIVKAWADPNKKDLRTFRHLGKGVFLAGGKKIKTSSRMK